MMVSVFSRCVPLRNNRLYGFLMLRPAHKSSALCATAPMCLISGITQLWLMSSETLHSLATELSPWSPCADPMAKKRNNETDSMSKSIFL